MGSQAKSRALAFLLLGGASGQALAEQPSPTAQAAKQHFDSGTEFYRAGDYGSDKVEFEAGYLPAAGVPLQPLHRR